MTAPNGANAKTDAKLVCQFTSLSQKRHNAVLKNTAEAARYAHTTP